MARGRGSGKHSGSKPTSSRRAYKQDVMQRYTHAREEAQLLGLIPTTPEEALDSEVVDPATQTTDAAQVAIVNTAIRQGWAVPEERKPALVDEMVKIVDNPEESAKTKVAAFNALRMADQQQYERDYPDRAAKAKGGTTINNTNKVVQENQATVEVIKQLVMDGHLGRVVVLPPSDESSSSGDGGLESEVEAIPTPGSDQQPTGGCVDDSRE